MSSTYEQLKGQYWRIFWATYEGERYRFCVTEHVNIGDGLMLKEVDGKLPGVISDHSISDIKWTDQTYVDLILRARGEGR